MSLNNTPSSERIHIGIFGKRNAGKSSIINALTGQDLSIVSDIRGTTTDPVLKAMELLPLGAVVMIDKAHQMLNKTDIAVLVVDGTAGMTREDDDILDTIQAKSIPCIVVLNKADLIPDPELPAALAAIKQRLTKYALPVIQASAASRLNIQELK